MLKLFNLFVFIASLTASYAFAQSSIFTPPDKSNSSSMSASDFQNTVNKMSQQTRSNLSQQAKDLYPKAQQGNQQPNTQTQASTPTAPTTPNTVDNSFSVNSGDNSTKTAGSTQNEPSSQPGSNYSGFGTTNNGGTKTKKPANAPASSGSSGGWNINY